MGSVQRGRPRVAVPWVSVASIRAISSRSSRAPVPGGRHGQQGDSRRLSSLSWWSNLAGRRPQHHAAGMAQVCVDRGRSQTARGASPRRNGALWWCMRVNGRSSTPNPLPRPKSKKPQPWQTTCGMGTLGGLPAGPMPKRLSPRMRAKGRDAEGAGPVPGGLTPSALAAWQTPAARAAAAGDAPQRLPPRRSSRASVWWSRLRPWPRLKRTRGGRCWPRR